jgi:hypothetical protein
MSIRRWSPRACTSASSRRKGAPAVHYTAIAEIDAARDIPSVSLHNVCAERAFIARLIGRIAIDKPSVIVIDKVFGADSAGRPGSRRRQPIDTTSPTKPLAPPVARRRSVTASTGRAKDTLMKARHLVSILALLVTVQFSPGTNAQDKPYKEGSVWSISFVKVKNGLFDEYMNEVFPTRKKIMDEAKRQGLVLSYKVFAGSSNGRDDWDVMFMEEYKNWAAMDGLSDKFDAINAKLIGTSEARTKLMLKRSEVRELLGDKLVQELVAK